MQQRRFLFLESFAGGSHLAFAEGLRRHSAHEIELLTLPASNWRWRRRGAALRFADRLAEAAGAPRPSANPAARPLTLEGYDGLIVSDLLDLADLRALVSTPPVLLYMHESQMTYPLPKGRSVDTDTAFTDIRNATLADRILFNSEFHRARFFEVAGEVLSAAPAGEVPELLPSVRDRAGVLYPGCELADLAPNPAPADPVPADATPADPAPARESGPLIVWNHRWEYDKNPRPFFRSLETLSSEGRAFRLVLLGENPQYHPKEFEAARESLRPHIVHYGYASDRETYARTLRAADIVVSTSLQENFGIATVEAVAAGCVPLLPRRLSYPEIIPSAYHDACLYGSNRELLEKLRRFVVEGPPAVPGLSAAMRRRYDWRVLAPRYDRELLRLAAAG